MKSLCQLKRKDLEKSLRNVMKEVAKPRYVCEKCARASREKKHLCKPVKIVRASTG